MATAQGIDRYKVDSGVNTADIIHGNPYGLTGPTNSAACDLSQMTGMPNYPISGAGSGWSVGVDITPRGDVIGSIGFTKNF